MSTGRRWAVAVLLGGAGLALFATWVLGYGLVSEYGSASPDIGAGIRDGYSWGGAPAVVAAGLLLAVAALLSGRQVQVLLVAVAVVALLAPGLLGVLGNRAKIDLHQYDATDETCISEAHMRALAEVTMPTATSGGASDAGSCRIRLYDSLPLPQVVEHFSRELAARGWDIEDGDPFVATRGGLRWQVDEVDGAPVVTISDAPA